MYDFLVHHTVSQQAFYSITLNRSSSLTCENILVRYGSRQIAFLTRNHFINGAVFFNNDWLRYGKVRYTLKQIGQIRTVILQFGQVNCQYKDNRQQINQSHSVIFCMILGMAIFIWLKNNFSFNFYLLHFIR